MKIAVLALGSLTADPKLRLDGPLLPIEFTWTAPPQEGRLILALCDESWVLNVLTPWVMSTLVNFDQARHDLAQRENVLESEIGYLKLGEKGEIVHQLNSLHTRRNEVLRQLTQWKLDNHFDAVIWRDRDTDTNIMRGKNLDVAGNEVITHLQGDAEAAAAKYVRGVPIQVWTTIRARIAVQPIAVQAGWMPGPGNAAITTADDLRFKDWQECRTTIGRLDGTLEDLRKVGFSLITALLTAGAFLGFSVSAPSPDVRGAVFIAIMALVAALFSIDTYYQVLLSGATERALDLEAKMVPPIRVTKYLSINATNSKASYITLFLYLILLATAGGVGLMATGELSQALSSLGARFWVWVAGLVVLLGAIFLTYWRRSTQSDQHPLRLIIGAVLGVWFTGGLGLLLLESTVTKPPSMLSWVVGVGMFLAVYIELYWVFVAFKTNLHREKSDRHWPWPEGNGKVSDP